MYEVVLDILVILVGLKTTQSTTKKYKKRN